ncbi:hypothetical protein [Carboxylicivirga marina]|uniref:Phage integrase SAM-like domain-containing protein n=1 Tax=Carboxylicivirga marina TaxID=2800988 RepID=A0ABS1HPX7_9BACT|nr:hypothetical protein [Carboxylicivirga marina]MBK3519730.1 hypothetical protein [Carboxylicivirga marina]
MDKKELQYNIENWYDFADNQQSEIKRWFRATFMKSNRWNKKAILSFIHNDNYIEQLLIRLFQLAYEQSSITNKAFIDYCIGTYSERSIHKVEMTDDFYNSFIEFLYDGKKRGHIKSSNRTLATCINHFCDAPNSLSSNTIRDLLSE